MVKALNQQTSSNWGGAIVSPVGLSVAPEADGCEYGEPVSR
jgi:hypothetical protein